MDKLLFCELSQQIKGLKILCPSQNTKITKFINANFFESGVFCGNSQVNEIISKKERQTVIVPVVLFQWEPSSCNQLVD